MGRAAGGGPGGARDGAAGRRGGTARPLAAALVGAGLLAAAWRLGRPPARPGGEEGAVPSAAGDGRFPGESPADRGASRAAGRGAPEAVTRAGRGAIQRRRPPRFLVARGGPAAPAVDAGGAPAPAVLAVLPVLPVLPLDADGLARALDEARAALAICIAAWTEGEGPRALTFRLGFARAADHPGQGRVAEVEVDPRAPAPAPLGGCALAVLAELRFAAPEREGLRLDLEVEVPGTD